MPPVLCPPLLLLLVASAAVERQRIDSRLLNGFSQWWQMPVLLLGGLAVVAFVVRTSLRDTAELPGPARVALAMLRLGAFATVGIAALDFERIIEREIVQPSRVAVLVDSSASMTLTDDGSAAGSNASEPPAPSRFEQSLGLLRGGLLAGLSARHEVALWRFDGAAERLALVPPAAGGSAGAGEPAAWSGLAAGGAETRLGDALGRVLAEEPAATLAGIVVLSDGGNNSGVDPVVIAARAKAAGVPVLTVGIGSELLPPNVRIADVVAPARVFPDDRFAVTAYLQAQELAGRTVRVELDEVADAAGSATSRSIDAVDVLLAADGELTPVRFDVPGLRQPGRTSLRVRVVPPAGDRRPGDDSQSADIEVVDRVTRVLLMSGGPGREFQFMRNVLDRDATFTVDVLLGTAAAGISQDARTILPAFPASAEALAEYDTLVAIDFDWRRLDLDARGRLERWVAREAGGLVLMAGDVFMNSWLSDPRMDAIRSLFPVELPRSNQLGVLPIGASGALATERPRPLRFSRDGTDAEFLWLAPSRAANEAAWSGFPGVHACFRVGPPKPGATVYALVEAPGSGGSAPYLVGQPYGSGSVLFCGSAELWRLRGLDSAAHERIVSQIVRHVAAGRLLRGASQGRLLVDRERAPVGTSVMIRVVLPEAESTAASPASAGRPRVCDGRGPSGERITIPLAAEPGRSDVLRGSFVMTHEGPWQLDVALPGGSGPLSRRIQGTLPDRELARPRLDRGLLEACASAGGGHARFLCDSPWASADVAAIVAALPDRSRRDYESGGPDERFKWRLNAALLAAGVGLLCLEWIGRRLSRLA